MGLETVAEGTDGQGQHATHDAVRNATQRFNEEVMGGRVESWLHHYNSNSLHDIPVPPTPPPTPPSPPPGPVEDEVIPRRIFTYWDGPLPAFVAACLASMRVHNPGWQLTILNESSVDLGIVEPMPAPPDEKKASTDWYPYDATKRSDWYRLSAVSNYGGVWLDATTVHLKPINAWVDMRADAIQGYIYPLDSDHMAPDFDGTPDSPATLESWAFAAPQNSAFMRLWRENFRHALTVGLSEYSNPDKGYVSERVMRAPKLVNNSYLAVFIAWREAFFTLNETRMIMHSGEDIGKPLQFLRKADWGTREFVTEVVRADEHQLAPSAFIKFRGAERNELMSASHLECSPDSWIGKQMLGWLQSQPDLVARVEEMDSTSTSWGACPFMLEPWWPWLIGALVPLLAFIGLLVYCGCRRPRQQGEQAPLLAPAAAAPEKDGSKGGGS